MTGALIVIGILYAIALLAAACAGFVGWAHHRFPEREGCAQPVDVAIGVVCFGILPLVLLGVVALAGMFSP